MIKPVSYSARDLESKLLNFLVSFNRFFFQFSLSKDLQIDKGLYCYCLKILTLFCDNSKSLN